MMQARNSELALFFFCCSSSSFAFVFAICFSLYRCFCYYAVITIVSTSQSVIRFSIFKMFFSIIPLLNSYKHTIFTIIFGNFVAVCRFLLLLLFVDYFILLFFSLFGYLRAGAPCIEYNQYSGSYRTFFVLLLVGFSFLFKRNELFANNRLHHFSHFDSLPFAYTHQSLCAYEMVGLHFLEFILLKWVLTDYFVSNYLGNSSKWYNVQSLHDQFRNMSGEKNVFTSHIPFNRHHIFKYTYIDYRSM